MKIINKHKNYVQLMYMHVDTHILELNKKSFINKVTDFIKIAIIQQWIYDI